MKKRVLVLAFFFVFLNGKAQTGIGTTTPVNKLEIVTTKADPASTGATANGNFRLGATVGTHVLDFGLSSSSTYSWLQARDKGTYATNYFLSLNPNGGYVGIGTTTPMNARLTISATSSASGLALLNIDGPTTGALATSTLFTVTANGIARVMDVSSGASVLGRGRNR